jgi:hypothetical protein
MYEDSLILKYEQTLIQTNYLIKNNIQLYIFFVLLTHVIATEGMSVVFSNIFVKGSIVQFILLGFVHHYFLIARLYSIFNGLQAIKRHLA